MEIKGLATAGYAVLTSTLLLATFTAHAGPELVSSDVSGTPFISTADETLLDALGISEDGNYVLFSDPGTCTIYRKDRNTGELLTVLESSDAGYKFCGGAELSDDGNLVAASPTQLFPNECIDERPDENGEIGCYFGELTELLIKNIATGEITEITREFISRSAGDIGRIPGDSSFRYGVALQGFAGDGGHAVISTIQIEFGIIYPSFRLIDVAAGTNQPIAPQLADDQTIRITSASISDDGNRLALLASIITPPTPPEGTYCPGPTPGPGLPPTGSTGPSAVIICGQTGRCDVLDPNPGLPVDGSGGSYWEWGFPPDECLPDVQGPDVFIWDRAQELLTALNAAEGEGVLPVVHAPVISGDGNTAAWLNRADLCYGLDANTGAFIPYPCDGEGESCESGDCDNQLFLANLLSETRARITAPDPETDVCATGFSGGIGLIRPLRQCDIELSDDGQQVLYARTLTHPYGGDWSVDNSDLPNTCIDRAAWENNAEVIEVECTNSYPGPGPGCYTPSGPQPCELPENYDPLCNYFGSPYPCTNPLTLTASSADGVLYNNGPIIGFSTVNYSEPLTWHLFDASIDHTTLVSIDDANQLFHASAGKLAGNGSAWAFDSRDPRLQDIPATPPAVSEAELDAACFWSLPGSSANLRIVTNDNVVTDETDDQIVYPGTPVLCPVPDPELPRYVFADEIGNSVNLAVMTFRGLRGLSQNNGNMRTWFGNFSPTDASLVALNFEISRLGEDGSVDFDERCEVYPPTGADESFFVRCDIGALARAEMGTLQWQLISPGTTLVEVKTSIVSNEHDFRPERNTDTDALIIRLPRVPLPDTVRGGR